MEKIAPVIVTPFTKMTAHLLYQPIQFSETSQSNIEKAFQVFTKDEERKFRGIISKSALNSMNTESKKSQTQWNTMRRYDELHGDTIRHNYKQVNTMIYNDIQ